MKYEDEYEKLNSSYQVAWNKVMEKGPLTSASYESAAALLISWDKDFDDLDVKEEVRRISNAHHLSLTYQRSTASELSSPRHSTTQFAKFTLTAVTELHHRPRLISRSRSSWQMKTVPRGFLLFTTPDMGRPDIRQGSWNFSPGTSLRTMQKGN